MNIRTNPKEHGLPSPPEDTGMAEEGLLNSIGVRVGQLYTLLLHHGGDTPIDAPPVTDRDVYLEHWGRRLGARLTAAATYARQYEIENDDLPIVRGLFFLLAGVRGELDMRLVNTSAKATELAHDMAGRARVQQAPTGHGGRACQDDDEPAPRRKKAKKTKRPKKVRGSRPPKRTRNTTKGPHHAR
jgi:hypothetical protein